MANRTPAAFIAFTAPINPPGVEPLTREQVWRGLQRKTRHAEEFVGQAISHTDVISESRDEHGREVVTREVIMVEGGNRRREVCTLFEPMKVEFRQEDGSNVMNIISDGADGQLYMTYQFEWLFPGMDKATLDEKTVQFRKASKTAVEYSIKVIREMIADGRLEK